MDNSVIVLGIAEVESLAIIQFIQLNSSPLCYVSYEKNKINHSVQSSQLELYVPTVIPYKYLHKVSLYELVVNSGDGDLPPESLRRDYDI